MLYRNYQLRENTKKYLERYNEILCDMSKKMLSQNIRNSITINFIECMVPHHQAAIYICENLLKYTKYQQLQKISNNIIQNQKEEIEEMKEIGKTTRGYINSRQEIMYYMNEYRKITENMLEKMKNSPNCSNINLNFINEMISHHDGAILMCYNLLKYRIDPRIKQVAETIIVEQKSGIKQLKEIQKKLCMI